MVSRRPSVLGTKGSIKHRPLTNRIIGSSKKSLWEIPSRMHKGAHLYRYRPTSTARKTMNRQSSMRKYVLPSFAHPNMKYQINVPIKQSKFTIQDILSSKKHWALKNGESAVRINLGPEVHGKHSRLAGEPSFVNYHSLYRRDPSRGAYGRVNSGSWTSGNNAHVAMQRSLYGNTARVSAKSITDLKRVANTIKAVNSRAALIDKLPNNLRRHMALLSLRKNDTQSLRNDNVTKIYSRNRKA